MTGVDRSEWSIVRRIATACYDSLIRERLPQKIRLLNGIPTKKGRLFDITDVEEEYENELLSAIENCVRSDDIVVIIGGGWGVSAVVAARHAGKVICYEASDDQRDYIKQTLDLNNAENVELRHAIVGEDVAVYGESTADNVDPSDLPECDVLELDCEGAEQMILESLPDGYRPRQIIVEIHPQYGVDLDDIKSILNSMGYRLVNREVEDTDSGVEILTAER